MLDDAMYTEYKKIVDSIIIINTNVKLFFTNKHQSGFFIRTPLHLIFSVLQMLLILNHILYYLSLKKNNYPTWLVHVLDVQVELRVSLISGACADSKFFYFYFILYWESSGWVINVNAKMRHPYISTIW